MRTILALCALAIAGCCDGLTVPTAPGPDAGSCTVTPIATLHGCANTNAVPLNLLAYPVDPDALTVYVDGIPQPPAAWRLTNDGHTLTVVDSTCNGTGDEGPHLVAVSQGCAVAWADCSVAYGCR